MGSTKMSKILNLGVLEAEKLQKRKWLKFCGTPCKLLYLAPAPHILAQFVVDCSSFNLPDTIRIPTHSPGTSEFLCLSQDWCFGISRERFRLLESCETDIEDDLVLQLHDIRQYFLCKPRRNTFFRET